MHIGYSVIASNDLSHIYYIVNKSRIIKSKIIVNPRCIGAVRVTVVGLCVCVSVTTILLQCAMQCLKEGTNGFSSKS